MTSKINLGLLIPITGEIMRHKSLILFIVLLVSFFSQVARADIFEVVSSRAPKYLVGSLLTETPNVKRKGESFTLKTIKSIVLITGGGDCRKNCQNDLSCLLKCLATSPSCVPSVFWGKSLSFLRIYSIPEK
jgi:hypothetical protein